MLRYTSLGAAVFAFALIVWGGIVRIHNAGMTCPDWPRCRGVWFPNLSDSVFYEWTHRFGAPVLTLLIIATAIAAWRVRRELPAAWRASWFSVGLLAAQIVVGALTIKYANNPPSVAVHLGLGTLTFVSLLMVWVVSKPVVPATLTPVGGLLSLVVSRLSLSAALATFSAILAAGYMSASNAGLACTQFPLCTGWGPAETPLAQIHMAHRLLAYLALVLVVGLALATAWFAARGSTDPHAFRPLVQLSRLGLVLAFIQVGLGVAAIVSALEPVLRSVHQANGVLLFATLAVTTYLAYANVPVAAGDARAKAPFAPQRPA